MYVQNDSVLQVYIIYSFLYRQVTKEPIIHWYYQIHSPISIQWKYLFLAE